MVSLLWLLLTTHLLLPAKYCFGEGVLGQLFVSLLDCQSCKAIVEFAKAFIR